MGSGVPRRLKIGSGPQPVMQPRVSRTASRRRARRLGRSLSPLRAVPVRGQDPRRSSPRTEIAYRRILARTTEQTGQKCCHGEPSEANRAVTQCRLISRRGPIGRHNQTKYMVQSGVAETGAQVASLIRRRFAFDSSLEEARFDPSVHRAAGAIETRALRRMLSDSEVDSKVKGRTI